MKRPFDRQASQYMYVLVRGDLLPTTQVIQGCHAAMQAAHQSQLDGQERLVWLVVRNQHELLMWKERLSGEGVECHLFFEPDHDLHYTALCTTPVEGGLRCLSKLPLWKMQEHSQILEC